MKKIFTLMMAAALAMPAFAAKVDIKCYKSATSGTGSSAVYSPDETVYLGTFANQSISYDAADDSYTFENFIGYDKANFSFKIKDFKAPFDESRIALEFTTPYGESTTPELAERTSIAYNLGSPNYKLSFYLNPERGLAQTIDQTETRDNPVYRSGEFLDGEKVFALSQPDLAVNGAATNNYYTTRTYAVKDGDKYKIYIRTTTTASWSKENGEWVYDDNTYWRIALYLCFEITDKLEGMEGGGDSGAIDVTVDTYDSQNTKKVAESFNSKLSCDAEGVYTLKGFYGDENDLKFKIGEYNETYDDYAVEFKNVSVYPGFENLPYLLNNAGGYATFKPVEIDGSGIPAEITYVVADLNYSYIYKENGRYYANINWSGSIDSGYTDYYNAVFSWPDANGGVDGIEIDNANAPVEYYNLQGMKVENPAAGLYIRRQGDSVKKVIIK